MNIKTTLFFALFAIAIAAMLSANPLESNFAIRKISAQKKHAGENRIDAGLFNNANANIKIVGKWNMPHELIEISGIAWINENRFACVQDEDGTIFIFNSGSSKVEKKVAFAGPGDYEGIALINEVAYVMRSDGVFFKIDNINSSTPAVTKYETHLTVQNDVEGFTYDKNRNRLLAAMKGYESGQQIFKGIYAIDPLRNTMHATPAFRLNLAEGGKTKKNRSIQPSAISVHPISNELYIIDAAIPALKILNQAGEEKGNYTLNKKDFPQPEGITFSPDGKIFISNEGKKEPGNILEVRLVE